MSAMVVIGGGGGRCPVTSDDRTGTAEFRRRQSFVIGLPCERCASNTASWLSAQASAGV